MSRQLRSSVVLVNLVAVCLAVLGVAAGCGGGGGSSQTFQVVYSTDWTNYASSGGGRSQRVTLYDSNNLALGTTVLNQSSGNVQQFVFPDVAKGTQRLVVQLFGGENLAGGQTGVLEMYVTVSAATTVSTAVGSTPTELRITPPSAALTVPQNQRFVASAWASTNVATFYAPGSITWSQTGGVVSVDSSGVATATTAGSGAVGASLASPSLTASAPVTVQAASTATGKWTVMVYMNAANDLSPYALTNVNQMESVAQNSNVRFVVQWKQATVVSPSLVFNGTRRYLVKADTSAALQSTLVQDLGEGVDMGLPETLHDFVTWSQANYPADRYVLVIWNHGNGWRRSPADLAKSRAVSYDDETGNSIQVWQLGQALSGTHTDMIAWDASLMQMMEVAYEIRSYTDYVIGSEESPPGEGYPYDLIFKEFRDTPNADTATLSKAFVDGMLAVPAYQNRQITQSVLRTDRLSSLATALDTLAGQLIANVGDLTVVMPTVRSATKMYSPHSSTPARYYLDVNDLMLNMQSMISIPSIDTAAADVRTAVASAVVWEGHTSLSDGSYGVSIDFTPGSSFASSLTDYRQMLFPGDTRWDEWLLVNP